MIADSRVVRTDYTPSRALPWLAILAWLTPFVMVFGVIRPFIAQAFHMASTSMEPTIRQNDHVLVDKLAYKLGPLRRDDIVVYTTPKKAVSHFNEAANASCLARVAALPGDTVEVRARGEVIVNGKMVGAPSGQVFGGLTVKPPFRVANGECFVLGDNHDASYDSRFWGTLPVKNVIGRVTLVYAPRLQAFDRE
jgi:signal peptidase I